MIDASCQEISSRSVPPSYAGYARSGECVGDQDIAEVPQSDGPEAERDEVQKIEEGIARVLTARAAAGRSDTERLGGVGGEAPIKCAVPTIRFA